MVNITISMDEDTARWVRVEAAKAGMSVSRWVGKVMTERRQGDDRYHQAARAFVDRGSYNLGFAGRAPKREEIYEELLHRHHDAGVREGSQQSYEAKTGDGVDRSAGGGKGRRRKRPGAT